MTRTLPLLAVLAPVVTGCIVYEDRDRGDKDCVDCTTVSTTLPDAEPPVDEEPEPQGPQATDLLALTVKEAVPGASLLSALVPLDPEIDLDGVRSVTFERDVAVVDAMFRPFEVVLLLQVDSDAELGDVAVSVETETGNGWILSEPFHIVEAADGSAGTPGTSTGCP